MNILGIFYGTPGRGSEWERVSKLYEIISNKHNISLVVYSPEFVPKREYNIDLDLIVMNKLEALLHFKHYVPEENFDLVFGNNSMAAFLANIGTSIPVLYDIHGGMLEEHQINAKYRKKGYNGALGKSKYLLKYIMEKTNMSMSSCFFVVSRYMMDVLIQKWGVNQNQIQVVPNGVFLNGYEPSISPSYYNEELIFGYIGGFNYWQGTLELEEAAINYGSAQFLFVGKDSLDKQNIRYIDRVPQSEVQSYYAACDILVLPRPKHPATTTASPTKFAEYGAMRKPILTTDVGQPAELVKEYNCGIVVESTDELTAGFREFEQLPKEELSQMGTNAREMVREELTVGMMENRIMTVLSD